MNARPDGAGTVTIPDVELVKLGTWAASTGLVNLTPQDFADAVAAAADPQVDAGPVKIGHTGPLAALGDSAPALGWIGNVRLSADGTTIIGDLTHVPETLADIIPAAYRRRSVELAFNVRTPAGKAYRMALTGVALLGVTPPAVKGLADITALYRPQRAAASGTVADSTAALIMGGADVAELTAARSAVAALASSAGASPAAVAALEQALDGLADIGSIGGIPPSVNSRGQSVPMPVDEKRMREILGIAEADSLEEALTNLKKTADAKTPPAATPPATPPGTPAPAAAATPPATPPVNPPLTPPAVPAATATPPATPAVPAAPPELVGALSQMVTGAVTAALEAAGVTGLVAESKTSKIDAALSDAIRTGRILPAEAAAFRPSLEANLEVGKTLLSGLAPGKYPTVELGTNDPAAVMLAQANEAEWAAFGASIGVPGITGAAAASQPPPPANQGGGQ